METVHECERIHFRMNASNRGLFTSLDMVIFIMALYPPTPHRDASQRWRPDHPTLDVAP